MVYFDVGDLVFDIDLGVGIVKQIMQDDNEVDGLIYLVWWGKIRTASFEYSIDLVPLRNNEIRRTNGKSSI